MSFKSTVKLDSKIFKRGNLRRALSGIAPKSAKEFTKDVQDKMENSPHTGKTVTKARGETFRIRHRQSRRGQRPAPFSRDLLNSIKARRTGDFTAQVDSDSEYANKLIFEDARIIVSDQDLKDARDEQEKTARRALQDLL